MIYLPVLLVFIGFCSCSETIVYSCDSDANIWVKRNLEQIQQMSREEWEMIESSSYQHAAYVAFPGEKKEEFWNAKLSLAMELDWNEKEKAHIAKIIEYIDKDKELFIRDTPTDDFYIFVYKWIEYAREELNWEDPVIWSILMSGNTVADKNGGVIVSVSDVPLTKNTVENCDCHRGNIMWTTCSSLTNNECMEKTCEASVHGCGAMWVESCNGVCSIN